MLVARVELSCQLHVKARDDNAAFDSAYVRVKC